MRHVAIDPRTGLHLRDATADEIAAYTARNAGRGAFSRAVKIGDVLIDEDHGPGIWHGGAGF